MKNKKPSVLLAFANDRDDYFSEIKFMIKSIK
jgi:hypothetical protein